MNKTDSSSALQMTGETFKEAFAFFPEIIMINVLWVIFTLLVITAPPAAAGMYFATNQIANDKPITWRTFFEGFRQYFWPSWGWAVLNLVIIGLCVFNVLFYLSSEATIYTWLAALFITFLFLWLLLQMYTFPLLIQQEQPKLGQALRNSLALLVKRPQFAIGQLFLILIIAGVSTLLQIPWLLFTASLITFIENRSTIFLVRIFKSAEPVAKENQR